MSDIQKPGGSILTPLIFFVMTAAVAIFLFIGAFVMWLASLTGSIAVAALITAGFFTVLAIVIYMLSVHTTVAYIRDRLETIYEVASRINNGYNWLSEKFSFLSFLRKPK